MFKEKKLKFSELSEAVFVGKDGNETTLKDYLTAGRLEFSEMVKSIKIPDKAIDKIIKLEIDKASCLGDFVDVLYKKFFKRSCQGKVHFVGLENLQSWFFGDKLERRGNCKVLTGSETGVKIISMELNRKYLNTERWGIINKKFNFEGLVETIVHELVHVWQHAKLGNSFCESMFKVGDERYGEYSPHIVNHHTQTVKEKLNKVKSSKEYKEFKSNWNKFDLYESDCWEEAKKRK